MTEQTGHSKENIVRITEFGRKALTWYSDNKHSLSHNRYQEGDENRDIAIELTPLVKMMNRPIDTEDWQARVEFGPQMRDAIAEIFIDTMEVNTGNPAVEIQYGDNDATITESLFRTPLSGIFLRHRRVVKKDGSISEPGTYYQVERWNPKGFERFVQARNDE